MHTNQRTWTDRRDGTRWTISGYWATHELLMGRIVFSAEGRSFETWCVSNRGVRHVPEADLENLLDEARAAEGGRDGPGANPRPDARAQPA